MIARPITFATVTVTEKTIAAVSAMLRTCTVRAGRWATSIEAAMPGTKHQKSDGTRTISRTGDATSGSQRRSARSRTSRTRNAASVTATKVMPGHTKGQYIADGIVVAAMGQRRLFYGWTIVGIGMLVSCMGLGAMFSLGVFLKPISESMGWSRTGISTVALLNWVFMGLGSFIWGSLSDRIGTRAVVLCGGVLLGFGMVTASQAATLGQFQLLFG